MPKMKTNRATAKRIKRTGTGKFKRSKAYGRHHLGVKTRKRKRQLHTATIAKRTEKRHLEKLLP